MSIVRKRNKPESKCDECEREAACYKDGRLFGYISLADVEVYPELGRNGHAMLRIGESCPKEG